MTELIGEIAKIIVGAGILGIAFKYALSQLENFKTELFRIAKELNEHRIESQKERMEEKKERAKEREQVLSSINRLQLDTQKEIEKVVITITKIEENLQWILKK